MKKYWTREFDGLGEVTAAECRGHLTDLSWNFTPEAGDISSETRLIGEVWRQLGEYLAGGRREFSLPLEPRGTEFCMRCWDELTKIPYGETRSYGELARAAGSPLAYRAAGAACHRNPICIVIPCHRVIGADGSLTGFGGGLERKTFLLELERGYVCN